jgi:hypothetical protein
LLCCGFSVADECGIVFLSTYIFEGTKIMAAKKKTSSSDKNLEKARADARKRATKYGTPIGSTKVVSTNPSKSNPKDVYRSATTVIKSARGNMYEVRDTKTQRKMLPDTSPWITVKPVNKPKPVPKKKK